MPHQLVVTIRAMVAAEQVDDLRKWLAASAPQGLADGPFHFRRMRGLHFAKLFLVEQTDDLEGRPIPASLVLMTEVDAPLRRHLDELIDVAGRRDRPGVRILHRLSGPGRAPPGPDRLASPAPDPGQRRLRQHGRTRAAPDSPGSVFARCAGGLSRPGRLDRPGARRHAAGPAGVCGGASGSGVGDDAGSAAIPGVPTAGGGERGRGAVGPRAFAPALAFALPAWAVALRLAERRDTPVTERPTLQHLETVASYEDYTAQNPFAVVGFIKPGALRLITIRGVMFTLNYATRHIYNGPSLGGITTIHFARWVPLDGWRRMTFASNYDGAVEAYNDDFIDEVWWGLNAAFGNAVGYPPTRWLFWGGAKYEEQFRIPCAFIRFRCRCGTALTHGSARSTSRTTPRSVPACTAR